MKNWMRATLWTLIALFILFSVPSPKPSLAMKYYAFNRLYFGHRLPVIIPVYDKTLDDDIIGQTTQDKYGQFHVRINPKNNSTQDEENNTLKHEMCHVETWVMDDGDGDHGIAFGKCVRRVADASGVDWTDIY